MRSPSPSVWLVLPAVLAALLVVLVVRSFFGDPPPPPPSRDTSVHESPPPPDPGAAEPPPAVPPWGPVLPGEGSQPAPVAPDSPRLRVRGRVVDAGGAPVADVAVGVARVWPGGSDIFAPPALYTDESGEFLVGGVPREFARIALYPGLPPGTPADELEARAVALSPPIEAGLANDVDLGDVVLGAPAAISGVVCDPAGEPVEGARIVAGLAGAIGVSRRTTVTDEDGRFRFDDLLSGQYTVHASREFPDAGWLHARADDVPAGESGLLLSLAPGSAILLRFGLDGRPDVPLPLLSGQLRRKGSSVVLAFGGLRNAAPRTSWRVLLPPGRHALRFEARGFAPVDLGEVLVEEGRETMLDLVLRRE